MDKLFIYTNSKSGLITLGSLKRMYPDTLKKVIIISDLITPNGLEVYSIKQIDSLFRNQLKEATLFIFTPVDDFSVSIKNIRQLEDFGFQIKLLPTYLNWTNHNIEEQQTIPFTSKDLIKYPRFKPNTPSPVFKEKSVLISGAGGSLGAQLSKTLHNQGCKKLILIDHSEVLISKLKLNFQNNENNCTTTILADIRDKLRLNYIFETHKPDLVIHLAAFKHVELMEADPYSAFKVNVIGTQNIFEATLASTATQFHFVSTDKAVEPKCIMGYTKKIAERLILNYPQNKLKTNIIRFGNILGSSGSVIEKFNFKFKQKQPLFVTNANMVRYFNIIDDVTNFIVSTLMFTNDKETIVFDSLEDTPILNLAISFLKLNGILYNHENHITVLEGNSFEKSKEKLFSKNELVVTTNHPNIKKVINKTSEQSILDAVLKMDEQLNNNQGITLDDFKSLAHEHSLTPH